MLAPLFHALPPELRPSQHWGASWLLGGTSDLHELVLVGAPAPWPLPPPLPADGKVGRDEQGVVTGEDSDVCLSASAPSAVPPSACASGQHVG